VRTFIDFMIPRLGARISGVASTMQTNRDETSKVRPRTAAKARKRSSASTCLKTILPEESKSKVAGTGSTH